MRLLTYIARFATIRPMSRKPSQKSEKRSAFSVQIPPDLLERARQKSAETGVPIAFILRKALEEWVDENKKR